MTFDTFAIYRGNGTNLEGDTSGSYRIVTPDRETADLLYRFIQDGKTFKDGNYKFFNLKRLSPQYWIFQSQDKDKLRGFFQELLQGNIPVNDRFAPIQNNFFFQQFRSNAWFDENALPPVLPYLAVADHVSGMEVFIRNKLSPDQYWYLAGDIITVSNTRRTKFRIEYANNPADRNTLLLADDDFVISALGDGRNPRIGHGDNGFLVTQGRNNSFRFGALTHGGFTVITPKDEVGDFLRYLGEYHNYGEQWEFV